MNRLSCQFCTRTWKQTTPIIKQKCCKRPCKNERYQQRDTKQFRVAKFLWLMFRKRNRIQLKKNQSKTISFIQASEYKCFTNFTIFAIDNNFLNTISYFDWILENKIPQRKWTNITLYQQWLKEWLGKETPNEGIERSLAYINEWATKTNTPINQFFMKISTNRAMLWLETGRVSPWLIYLCPTSNRLIDRLNTQQAKFANSLLNPMVWDIRAKRYKSEITKIKAVLHSAGL